MSSIWWIKVAGTADNDHVLKSSGVLALPLAVQPACKRVEKRGDLKQTNDMNRRYGKIVATLLALLLGLLPLQGTLAVVAIAKTDGMMGQVRSSTHIPAASGAVMAKAMTGTTAKAMDDGCCDQERCSPGHCSVCASIPFSLTPSSSLPLTTLVPSVIQQGIIDHINSPLFRPPRV